MADDKPSDEKPKFDPFKPAEPHLPGVPDKGPEATEAPRAEPQSQSGLFTHVIPVTVKWTSPAGRFFKEEAVASDVTDHGGMVQMKVLPLVAQVVELTNKANGQTTQARVVAMNRTKEGAVQGVTVEFPAPSQSFWGPQPMAAPAADEAADAAVVAPAGPAWVQKLPPRLRALPPVALYGGAGALLLLVVMVLWMALGSGSEPAPEQAAAPPAAGAPPVTSPVGKAVSSEPPPEVVRLPATVALTKDMAKVWSSKKFIVQQLTGRVPAMVVRIPTGSAGSSSGYWGFLATVPFGRCELELITDLTKLADEYNYRSNTPMVVDPCTQTLFHPLQMGSIGPSTYARGEVVRGTALRPPVMIDIRVERGQVIAVRTE